MAASHLLYVKAMEKNDFRRHHQALRKEMSREEVLNKSRLISVRLLQLPQLKKADVVFSYNAFGNEVILDPLMFSGWSLALPQVLDKESMVFRQIYEETVFMASAYGVMEPRTGQVIPPTERSVILVPGSCFDRQGNRIGYGAGYYDRILAKYPEAMTIGVCYNHQLVDHLPRQPHDQAVDFIVTEDAFFSTSEVQ